MKQSITEIFEAIQPPNHSMSIARRHWALGEVAFNGEQITSLNQTVEVENSSTFQVGKALWKFESEWIRR